MFEAFRTVSPGTSCLEEAFSETEVRILYARYKAVRLS